MAPSSTASVACPGCGKRVPEFSINFHLDSGCAPSSSSGGSSSSLPPPASSSTPTSASLKRKVPPTTASNDTAPTPAPTGKRFKMKEAVENAMPLAERVRPNKLEDFVGQQQLLGEGTMLRGLIEADKVGSCLFWGPPGTGKTTIARVIASRTKSIFKELSATNATTADLRKIFDEASSTLRLTGRKTLLFIDEMQRFTKSQQDNFLPVVEAGTISLIASTTENPSFRVNGALLSRCRVFVLNKLTPEDIFQILLRALTIVRHGEEQGGSSSSQKLLVYDEIVDEELLRFLSQAADGDARVGLSSLELALTVTSDASRPITRKELKTQLRRAHLQYDRAGDHHYDTISALHKAVRGGDADGSLYWLARMLQGGDDPLYVARRLIRMASEDIGLANPQALPQALAAYQATSLLGMPECDVILAHVVVMLAESPKSVRVYQAYKKAKSLVDSTEAYPVPIHIRNAPTGLMKSLGYGEDYKYNPDYLHPVYQEYLPPELRGTSFLLPEDSVKDKVYDEEALKQFEEKVLSGEKWEGRQALAARLGNPESEDGKRAVG